MQRIKIIQDVNPFFDWSYKPLSKLGWCNFALLIMHDWHFTALLPLSRANERTMARLTFSSCHACQNLKFVQWPNECFFSDCAPLRVCLCVGSRCLRGLAASITLNSHSIFTCHGSISFFWTKKDYYIIWQAMGSNHVQPLLLRFFVEGEVHAQYEAMYTFIGCY